MVLKSAVKPSATSLNCSRIPCVSGDVKELPKASISPSSFFDNQEISFSTFCRLFCGGASSSFSYFFFGNRLHEGLLTFGMDFWSDTTECKALISQLSNCNSGILIESTWLYCNGALLSVSAMILFLYLSVTL